MASITYGWNLETILRVHGIENNFGFERRPNSGIQSKFERFNCISSTDTKEVRWCKHLVNVSARL